MTLARRIKSGLIRIKISIQRALQVRLILDSGRRLGNFEKTSIPYDFSLRKEAVAREFVFSREGTGQTFLDVGGRDGELTYLLGITANLEFDKELYDRNARAFREQYTYYGLDVSPQDAANILAGDICDDLFVDSHPQFRNFFDVVYSNNVFEHLRRPWVAAKNIHEMLKPGGVCITIAPFSQRYHESPADYFRFTHTAIPALFQDAGSVETLVSGYDTTGRRNNWQGSGEHSDTCPVDRFGAWRETWFVVTVIRKAGEPRAMQ
jgi:SAM-dependent methyltransferase